MSARSKLKIIALKTKQPNRTTRRAYADSLFSCLPADSESACRTALRRCLDRVTDAGNIPRAGRAIAALVSESLPELFQHCLDVGMLFDEVTLRQALTVQIPVEMIEHALNVLDDGRTLYVYDLHACWLVARALCLLALHIDPSRTFARLNQTLVQTQGLSVPAVPSTPFEAWLLHQLARRVRKFASHVLLEPPKSQPEPTPAELAATRKRQWEHFVAIRAMRGFHETLTALAISAQVPRHGHGSIAEFFTGKLAPDSAPAKRIDDVLRFRPVTPPRRRAKPQVRRAVAHADERTKRAI